MVFGVSMGHCRGIFTVTVALVVSISFLASTVSAWDGPDIIIDYPTEGTIIGGTMVNVSGTAANGTHEWWRHEGRTVLETGTFTNTAVDKEGVALAVGGIAPRNGGCAEPGAMTSYISYTQGDLASYSEATFEMWIYYKVKPKNETILFEAFYYSGSLRLGLVYITLVGQHNNLLFTYLPADSDVWIPITTTLPEAGNWHHISGSYGNFGETISVDGKLSVLNHKTSSGRATDEMSLGHHATTSPRNVSRVFVDDFRVSRGQRYTSDFAVPSGPLKSDADTVILDNFDGATVGSNNGWTLHEIQPTGDYLSPAYSTSTDEPHIFSVGWTAHSVPGMMLKVYLRHSDAPDMSSASEWKENFSGSLMGASMSRYLQYKIHMETTKQDTPRFKGLALEYGGVSYVWASLDGNDWVYATGTENWTVGLTVPEGVVTVYIWAIDVSSSYSFSQVTFIVDQTPPTGYVRLAGGEDFTKGSLVDAQIELDDPSSARHMMVSLDPEMSGGEWVPFRRSFKTDIGTTEGEVTVYVKVREIGGLVSATLSDAINLDTTPPSGEIFLGDDTGFSLGPVVRLHSDVSDLHGISSMRYSTTGDSSSGSWIPYTDDLGVTFSYLDGLQDIYCEYRDPAGNVLILLAQIFIDLHAPTVEIEIAGGREAVSDRFVQVVVNASDAGGIASMRSASNPDDLAAAPWRAYNTSYILDLGTTDGNRMEWVEVIDAIAGRTQLTVESIILDTTPPTGSIVIEDDSEMVLDQQVTLSIEVSDASSGVSHIRLSNVQSLTGSEEAKPLVTMNWELLPGEGKRTVFLEVTDMVGNSAVFSDDVFLHTDRPTGSLSVAEELVRSRDVTLSLAWTSAVEVALYDDPEGEWTWQLVQGEIVFTLGPGDGTCTIYAWFRDEFMLSSLEVYAQVILDTTPPKITVTAPEANTVVRAMKVTCAGSASDENGIGSIEMSLNDDEWFKIFPADTWSRTMDLEKWGDHVIHLRVTDAAGNVAISQISFRAEEQLVVQSSGSDWWLLVLLIAILAVAVTILVLRMRQTSPPGRGG